MDTKKLLRYTMQLAMLKQLLTKKLIDENEYLLIQKKLMKDYGIVLMKNLPKIMNERGTF